MKFKCMLAGLLIVPALVLGDTPPPNTVKAKMFTGDGVTSITATGTAMNVNVTNTTGLTTVNQGNAGSQSWLASITASVLPTNACQETGGHLASLDTKTPALGQAIAGSSVPVVLPSAQITALTPPTTVTVVQPTGNNLHTVVDSLPATGSGSSQSFTATSQTFTLTTNGATTLTFLPSGTWSGLIGVLGSTDGVTFSEVVLPLFDLDSQTSQSFVASNLTEICQIGGFKAIQIKTFSTWTGTATVAAWMNAGTNATTVISPTSGGFYATANIRDGSSNPISSTGGSLNVDITNTSLAITAASLPLPTGAATASGLTTINTTLGTPFQAGGSIGNTSFAATQGTAANLNATVVGPAGVALAKDSSLTTINTTLGTPFQAGGSIANTSFAATQATASSLNATVVGTAGAALATSANQSTMITDLGTINTTLGTPFQAGGSIGNTTFAATQATAANLNATVVGTSGAALSTAANQATEIGDLASIVTNTTGASTSALQTTGNASLASIDLGIPAGLGLTGVSGSMPVVGPDATTVTTTAFTSVTGTLNTDMLTGSASGWFDAAGYNSFYADIYTTTTVTGGVITFEQTNDTTNDAAGASMNIQDSTAITQTNITSLTLVASTIKHYQAPITSRYIRFRISTAFAGTGTVGATVNFKQTAYNPIAYAVSQATAGSLNTTVGSGTITTVSTVTAANLAIPGIVADQGSGAIITTTTSATIVPTAGVGYIVDIPVTIVSGTLPTMSVAVNESDDTGTNWRTVYTFPTITTTGFYVSPPLFFRGNRIQYVQTIGGSSPSFTRAINRLQMSAVAAAPVNNNATFATAGISGVTTLTAPANAVGFILENLSSNTGNLFWTIGATAATSSSGMLLEPGRDTGEVHAGQNVSVCPSTGTVTYSIQWIQQ